MENKLLEHDMLKKLFLQKILAIKKKDIAFIAKLQIEHPELFDKKFLYQMLQKELKDSGTILPKHIEVLLENMINKIKIIQ